MQEFKLQTASNERHKVPIFILLTQKVSYEMYRWDGKKYLLIIFLKLKLKLIFDRISLILISSCEFAKVFRI